MLFSVDRNNAAIKPSSDKWRDSVIKQLSADFDYLPSLKFNSEIRLKTREDLGLALVNISDVPAKEQALYLEAYRFVCSELNKIGDKSPICIGPLSFDFSCELHGEDNFRGMVFPRTRSFHINTQQDLDWQTLGGIAVHEFTHLSGRVVLGQNTYLQSGFLIGQENKQRFHLLEEFVCLSLQSRFWRQNGLCECTKLTPTVLDFDCKTKDNNQFLAILSDVYLNTNICNFIEWQKISHFDSSQKIRSIKFKSGFEYNFESIYWSNGEVSCSSGYAEAFKAMIDLSSEIYFQWDSDAARLTVENMMLKFHSSGHLKEACKLFSGICGDTILPLLAFVNPFLDLDNPKRIVDLILFKAYVDAIKLKDEKREYIRGCISELISKPNQISIKLLLRN